jgi:class 3 adenylate cyclase
MNRDRRLQLSLIANALLGVYSSYTQASAKPHQDYRYQDVSWYVQDTWKIHRRLTLDLGTRFEVRLIRADDSEVIDAVRAGFKLERLPGTREEAQAIAQLYRPHSVAYVGADATEERVKQLPRDMRIVHYALHAVINNRLPLNSALALTIRDRESLQKENGLLHAWEILDQVRLNADLVTLSACETALGRKASGEGFVGFTQAVATIPPRRLVKELDEIFRAFDDIVASHGLEKIKTIGDAYMVAGGLNDEATINYSEAIANMALEMRDMLAKDISINDHHLEIRMGIGTGPVVAGVVGKKKFIYDLWGDTVNTASRMESHGVPGRVQVTASTAAQLRASGFELEPRGTIEVKGKGLMETLLIVRAPALDSA